MKYVLTAAVTSVLLLLIVVCFLLLKLAHGSIQCQIKGVFNQTEIAVPEQATEQLPEENRETKKRGKGVPKPSLGILVPAPPPEPIGKQE